jgi:ubiquitin-conjugating enzyme E2 N
MIESFSQNLAGYLVIIMDSSGRIAREIKLLATNPPSGVSAIPHPENNRHFDAFILGPVGSPFENGVFKLEIFLPENYPISPPKVRFLTKIYHPNIDKLGRICISILNKEWSPALSISSLLVSIQSLLSDPNPTDPLDTQIADQWTKHRSEAEAIAREWTQKYAIE